jgi:hypothetical protein
MFPLNEGKPGFSGQGRMPCCAGNKRSTTNGTNDSNYTNKSHALCFIRVIRPVRGIRDYLGDFFFEEFDSAVTKSICNDEG